MYAGRRRRKPLQKGVKPTPAEGAKTNPSKRHRDRLNSELDRLASLLPFPEDVISSLDKLSILRLSVSFLRTKSFFSVALKKIESGDHSETAGSEDRQIPEGELLLQALNGFVLVVAAEGTIFFCSPSIQDYLGFHQTDVMHQSVFELIHTEDQQEFRRNLHWALNPPADLRASTGPPPAGEPVSTSSSLINYNPDQLPPENSSFLERSFICRLRCLLDNTSGFLALNIQGRLKFLHGQNHPQCNGEESSLPQLALFAIATPLQSPAILEIRTRNMIFRTKHKLDFTPMACDAKGKIVLGYTEAELRVRGSGYQFIHAADMLYCAENHVRMIKTGESGLTVFRLLTKDNRWKWVQANARLVYKNGKPDYIIATQRPLVDEEGGEHLRKRSVHLPFTFTTGEAMLYHSGYPLHSFSDSHPNKVKSSKTKKGSTSESLDPKSLLGALMSQDESVYVCQPDSEPTMSLFSQQQDNSEYNSLLGDDSLSIMSNEEIMSYDPLLATLDSLSLNGEDACSNSELFNALENLGLNAEDLELLLLDERMIQVELDPCHVPTMSDLLTNNEVLSYIHDTLENGREQKEQRDSDGTGVNPDLPATSPSSSQTIIHLSQQMQQHLGAGEPRKADPTAVNTKVLTGLSNGHWVANTENHHDPNNLHQPHTILKSSQLNSEIRHLLESSQQWQQDQHTVHFPSNLQFSSQAVSLSGFQNQLTASGSYNPNGHVTCPPNVEVNHAYTITPAPHASASLLTSVTTPDICHYQSYELQAHQKQQQQQMLQQVPSSYFHHQSSALELEQLLGLAEEQHSMFNTGTQDSTHSKVESGRLLAGTNAAYIRTCLMPNGNGVAAGNLDGLSALQDHQTSGFFL